MQTVWLALIAPFVAFDAFFQKHFDALVHAIMRTYGITKRRLYFIIRLYESIIMSIGCPLFTRVTGGPLRVILIILSIGSCISTLILIGMLRSPWSNAEPPHGTRDEYEMSRGHFGKIKAWTLLIGSSLNAYLLTSCSPTPTAHYAGKVIHFITLSFIGSVAVEYLRFTSNKPPPAKEQAKNLVPQMTS